MYDLVRKRATRIAFDHVVPIVSLACGLLSLPLAAQEMRPGLSGVLLAEGSGEPVSIARIALVGPGDDLLAETISDERGAFRLPMPPPGAYRVRVTRIGYQPWASDTLHIAATASRTLSLRVAVRPIPLPDLLVSEQSSCPAAPEQLRRAFELYESVLPSLASSSSTADLRDLEIRMVRPTVSLSRGERTYDHDSLTVDVSTALERASPQHLEAYGYAAEVRDSRATFYAPDGEALASPGFLATHCLTTLEGEEGTRVGLAFEPKPDRGVVDVRGVLWIDAVSSEAMEVEFRYTSLRPFLRRHLEAALLEDVRSTLPRRAWGLVAFYRLAVDESRFGGVLHFDRTDPDSGLMGGWATR
ncbi:carboxypeptidase-like regulatory domain-containing protein [Candidatus Palauibacter sp.]|uniref:carboxypeptidase-like regulatory domain-containing protein n=1 Tax=Candidatus Palauibacter sp. TaxID=3101350 RepID=UPI003B52D411